MSITRLNNSRRISTASVSAVAGTYGIHPDARNWNTRVVENGGTVSVATLSAVSTFCAAISNAGIRDRFYRLNLFCGNSDSSLFAVRTPLYLGQSLTGTQFGNAMDTNNSFVSGDYNETGSSGGLLGNAATKYLQTGLPTNTLTAGDRHLSAYETVRSGSTYQRFIGSEGASAGGQQFMLGYSGTATVLVFGFGAFAGNLNSSTTTSGGHWLGVNIPSAAGALYKNGTLDVTTTQTAATPTSAEIYIYAINRQGSLADPYGGRLGGYSIGLSMTPTQAASYYAAMQAFQTALTRNV